jgi:hypothetical protein
VRLQLSITPITFVKFKFFLQQVVPFSYYPRGSKRLTELDNRRKSQLDNAMSVLSAKPNHIRRNTKVNVAFTSQVITRMQLAK